MGIFFVENPIRVDVRSYHNSDGLSRGDGGESKRCTESICERFALLFSDVYMGRRFHDIIFGELQNWATSIL